MEATKSRSRSFLIAALAAIMAMFAALAVALPQQAHADESTLTAGTIQVQASTSDDATWERLAGQSGLDTMAAIVDEGWAASDVAVLTTFDGYWDALTAASVAGQAKAPVLMTDGSALSSQTASVLAKLKPSKIIVVGGPLAIPDSVADAAKAATGTKTTVERLWGQDAVGTANDVFANGAAMTGGSWNSAGSAFVATNDGYWDALAAAPVSYASGTPIFLADGHASMTADTIETMKAGGINSVYIVGGEMAIEPSVESQLKDAGFTVNARLGGQTAVETSEEVAKIGILDFDMSPKNMGIATMNGYWDALTGAALCGLDNSPLVLAEDENSNSITDLVTKLASGVDHGYIFGGPMALPESLEPALEKISDDAAPEPAPTPAVDKSALQKAIADASAIEQGSKSDEAKAALDEAIAEAQAVANDKDATQDEVNAAVEALNEAIEEFNNSPDEEASETVTVHFVVPEGYEAPADTQIEYDTMVRDSAIFNGGAKDWPKMTAADGSAIYWYTSEDYDTKSAVGPKTSFTADATVYGKFQPYFTVAVLNADGSKAFEKTYDQAAFEALASESGDAQSANWNTTRVQTAVEYVTFADLVNDAAGDSAYWGGLSDEAAVTYGASDATSTRTVGQLNGAMFFSDITDASTGAPMTPCFGINWKSGAPSDGQSQGDVAAALAAELAESPSTAQAPRAFVSPTAAEQAEGTTPTGMQMLSSCLTLTVQLTPETVTVHFVVPEGYEAPADTQIEYDTMVRDSAIFNGGAKDWPKMTAADGSAIYWYTSEDYDTKSAVGPKTSFTADATVYGKFQPYFTVAVLNADGSKAFEKTYDQAAFEALASESGDAQSANWNTTRVQTAVEYVTFADLVNDAAGDSAYWGGLSDEAAVTYGASDATSTRTVGQLNGAMFFSDITDASTGAPMTPCFGINWKSGAPSDGQSQGDVAAALAAELAESPSTAQAPRAFVSPTAAEQAEGTTPTGMQMLSSCLTLTVQLAG